MNKLKNILHKLGRRSVCTIVLAGSSQLGLAQQNGNPWASEPSLIDPWGNAPSNAVRTDTIVTASSVFADSVIVEHDTAVFHNVGGTMVREVDVTRFNQGKRDAFKYYKSSGAGCTSFASGAGCLAFPGLLAVPTAISLSTPKKLDNTSNPRNYMLSEIDYANGYASGAKKLRARKAWGNFGIGVGFTGIIAILALSAN